MKHSPAQVRQSIVAPSFSIDALAIALDQMTHSERLEAVLLWDKPVQKVLHKACEGRDVLTSDIIPGEAVDSEIVHYERNTLPVFRMIEKHFAIRSEDADRSGSSLKDAKVIGYNKMSDAVMWCATPGYFKAYEDIVTGEFIIDYHGVPERGLESWPAVVSNSNRLGRFVYSELTDRLWKVSKHVTVGRVYKDDEPIDSWSVLVREE